MSRIYFDSNGNEIDPPLESDVIITNADRIRAMTDEELAEWLTLLLWGENREINFVLSCTVEKWLEWLKQEDP